MRPTKRRTQNDQQATKGAENRPVGVWLPMEDADRVCGLKLRPPSVWQVFLAVLFTARSYGGNEAYLTVNHLVCMTGLSTRTVKDALRRLEERGLLHRPVRTGHLHVNLGDRLEGDRSADRLAPRDSETGQPRGARNLAPPRCTLVCTSPNLLLSTLISNSGNRVLSQKQVRLIVNVLIDANELLGSDALQLPLLETDATTLGLKHGITFQQALETISTPRQARDFVGIVRGLRKDPRVQGDELALG